MPARLTSTRFVGRQGELAELELACSEAEAGRPGVILLGGDSGVGKTRLIAELEATVSERMEILHGESPEQGDGELVYAPLVGALRPLVRAQAPVLERLSPGSRARLAALLPSLSPAGARPAEPVNSDTAQIQLFESLLELLELISRERPLLLALEDIHWADRATRAFIAFTARSLRTERVLLLVSYRSDELHRRHPLRPLLAELDRLNRARRLELQPFDSDELAEALADILGTAPEQKLLARLLERTDGNPLFAEELLAAGLDGRSAAPQSLNDAFMLRVERLAPAA
ncbi:MAG: AAA family ATPase, partial [Solirubrobacterales bacterium]|nr:AAA family ATPase [Solirubrobacterales bacterium]